MEIILYSLLAIAIIYALIMLFAFFCSKPMIFPAPAASYDPSLPGLRYIPLSSGQITAFYLEAEQGDAPYTLLYSHGNAEDIGTQLPILKEYASNGWNVLIYDYPGYGLSNGSPSEEAVIASAEAAYQYLIHELNIPADKIVLYGRSLGGGPTIDLASRFENAGVILECTFTSIFRVVTRVAILPWDIFKNIDKIQDIKTPLLIFHGDKDIVVPFSHGQKLYDKAIEPKKNIWINGGGHNNLIELMGKKYWDELQTFRNKLDT